MSTPQLSITEDPKATFANAVNYRTQRIGDSNESIIHEVLSDIPHINDFISSCIAVVRSLFVTVNPSELLSVLPKLILSGVGVYAAVPNIKTIIKEKREHTRELRSILDIRDKFIENAQDNSVIERTERLEFEGIPNTGVHTLPDAAFEKARRLTDLSLLKRVHSRLKNPDPQLLKNLTLTSLNFLLETAKDSALNFVRPSSCALILHGGYKGLKYSFRSAVSDRRSIQQLSQMETLSEAIAAANKNEENNLVIQGRDEELSTLDQDLIKKLDRIQEAARNKANQLRTARTGFALQLAFINASLCLCAYHMSNQDWGNAAAQYLSANLASNPLVFVGLQLEELYKAIHSHRAEEAETLSAVLAEELRLPDSGDKPDISL